MLVGFLIAVDHGFWVAKLGPSLCNASQPLKIARSLEACMSRLSNPVQNAAKQLLAQLTFFAVFNAAIATCIA